MLIHALENFILFNSVFSLGGFFAAYLLMSAVTRDWLQIQPYTLSRIYTMLIVIPPVLSAWLALGGVTRPIRPDTVRAAIKRSGVEWPSNVTRHSFVSYHLAKFENAGKTALEAGHSEQMLFAHYRELVTGERAEQFWNLFPPMI